MNKHGVVGNKNKVLWNKSECLSIHLNNEIFNYSQEIKENPNAAEAYINRGIAYGDKGNDIKAISDFTKAIRINPNHRDAYYCRAVGYFYNKNFKKSWGDIHKAKALGAKIPRKFLNKLKQASGSEVMDDKPLTSVKAILKKQ